jgi:hypothetical protein
MKWTSTKRGRVINRLLIRRSFITDIELATEVEEGCEKEYRVVANGEDNDMV